MNEKEFNYWIGNNEGYYVFTTFVDWELTPQQRGIAFENAIKNDRGQCLLDRFGHKLTAEERSIAFENAFNCKNVSKDDILRWCGKYLTQEQKKKFAKTINNFYLLYDRL